MKTHLLKTVIDNYSGGFILTKPNGDAIVCNKCAEQLFDFKLDNEHTGYLNFDLVPELADALKNAVESGSAVKNVILKRKGVNLTVSVQPLIIESQRTVSLSSLRCRQDTKS